MQSLKRPVAQPISVGSDEDEVDDLFHSCGDAESEILTRRRELVVEVGETSHHIGDHELEKPRLL